MNNAVVVRRNKPLNDLQRVVNDRANWQRSFSQPFAQGFAFQQFTNDVRRPVIETNIIDSDDVGMVQRRCGASFQLETTDMIRVLTGSRANQLQRDVAPQPFIARPENLSHGSGADFLEDPVVTYDSVGHVRTPRWHVRGACPLPSITRSGRPRPRSPARTVRLGRSRESLPGKPRLAE